MIMRKLKLLVFGTVCWVAPLAAQQAPALHERSGCPFAHGKESAAQGGSAALPDNGIPSESSLLDPGQRSAVLVP